MVQSGVNFADLNVTLLSDGTGTYSFYKDRLDNDIYSAQKSYFEEVLVNTKTKKIVQLTTFTLILFNLELNLMKIIS